MNICTYVTATSMDPKLMTIAVYHNTKTHQNIAGGDIVLLQLLTEVLAPVVRICGQKSGKDIDKITRLQKRYDLKQHKDLYYFADAAGYIELLITDLHENGGDHTLVTGEVVHSKNLHDSSILTATYLKEHGFTR